MSNLNFHSYQIDDNDQYTSDFLNQIISDFSDNMTSLYIDYKDLVKRYADFLANINTGLDWLTTQAGVLAVGQYTVTGYSSPSSTANAHADRLFGRLYLQDFNLTSVIGRYMNDRGVLTAYASNKTYYADNSPDFVEDQLIMTAFNNKQGIWAKTTSHAELLIAIATPQMDNQEVNIFEAFPFAGTTVKSIEWKTSSGSWESTTVNSKYPVKLLGNFSYGGEFRIRLGGVAQAGGTYYYALRYADAYRCDLMDTGSATYSIGTFSTVSSITINDDYAPAAIKLKNPVRFEILSDDESYVYYDSNINPWPIQEAVAIEVAPIALKLRVTLYKKEEVTPVISHINVI